MDSSKSTDLFALFGITSEDAEEIDRNIHRMYNKLHIWGFDFETSREIFYERAKAHPVTDETPITIFGRYELYKNCQPEPDVNLFIYIFFKYGNVTKALLDVGDAVDTIKTKCDLYQIKIGAPDSHKLKFELTLSRIVRAFPVHAAKLILKEKFPGILTKSAFFGQELPLLMQHTIFPGLVPAKKFTDVLKWIAVVLNMEISVKLSSAEKGNMMMKTVEQLILSSNKYVGAPIRCKLDTDEEKLKILTQAGILEVNGNELKLSVATIALVSKFKDITALYPLKYSEALNVVKNFV